MRVCKPIPGWRSTTSMLKGSRLRVLACRIWMRFSSRVASVTAAFRAKLKRCDMPESRAFLSSVFAWGYMALIEYARNV